jgi:GT2 family glycosyltransferase
MKASVFIAIFSGVERGGWLCPELARFLVALTHEKERNISMKLSIGVSPVDYARNLIAKEFLNSGADWCLMIDNDQSVPLDILKMLDWAAVNAHIVVPMNFRSASNGRIGIQPVWEPLGAPTNEAWQELQACGAGVIGVRREVFERIGKQGPWFRFECDSSGKVTKGEDIYFCERARAVGCRILGNKNFTVEHYHTVGLASLAACK